jgi:hypothetical protein
MNKAFVREPEDDGRAYCPRCQSLGVPVQEATLTVHLKPEALEDLADTAWFCPFATCEVAYFDQFERVALVESLLKPVYPKDPRAPICPCFNFSTEEIEQDIAEGGVARTRALVAKAKSPAACCSNASPTGQTCIAEVQGYYMKHRNA